MNKKLFFVLLQVIGAPIIAKRHDVEYVDIYQAMAQIKPFFDDQVTGPERANQVWRDTKELLEKSVFRDRVLAQAKEVAKKVRIAFVVSAIQNELDRLQADKKQLDNELENFKRTLPENRDDCNEDHFIKWKSLSDLSALYAVVLQELDREYEHYDQLLFRRYGGDVGANLLSMRYWRIQAAQQLQDVLLASFAGYQWVKDFLKDQVQSAYGVLDLKAIVIAYEYAIEKSYKTKSTCCGEYYACAWYGEEFEEYLESVYEERAFNARLASIGSFQFQGDIVEGAERFISLDDFRAQDLSQGERLDSLDWEEKYGVDTEGEQEKTEADTDAQTESESDGGDKWDNYAREVEESEDDPPPLEDVPEDIEQELDGQEPASEEDGAWTTY